MLPLAQLTSSLPTNGTNAVHRITIAGTPTTGTFKLTWNGRISSAITWSATNSTLITNIQTALDALFGAGNTTAAVASMTAGVGTFDITFGGSYGVMPQAVVITGQVVDLDGSTTVVGASQTTGVFASYRGAAPGAQLIYTGTTPPTVYYNASNTLFAPNWSPLDTNQTLSANGAVTFAGKRNTCFMTKGTALAATLAAPTSGTDDGKLIVLVSTTAAGHVITCSTDGFNAKGSSGTLTFGGAIGDSATLVAKGGHWYVQNVINATAA